jgi:hypothetical protein
LSDAPADGGDRMFGLLIIAGVVVLAFFIWAAFASRRPPT